MNNVNFLPWREELRIKKQRKEKNKIVLVLSLFISVLIVWHVHLKNELHTQLKLNINLKLEQQKLLQKKSELETIENNNAQINMLLNEVLQLQKRLQQNEKLFVEISKSIPKSIILTQFLKKEDVVTIIGEAKSVQNIAEVLQYMSKSIFFLQPVLKEVKNTNNNHIFKIETKIKIPVDCLEDVYPNNISPARNKFARTAT